MQVASIFVIQHLKKYKNITKYKKIYRKVEHFKKSQIIYSTRESQISFMTLSAAKNRLT
jgi:hypothetical protein